MRTGMKSMHFEFATATRILFGPGRLRDSIPAAASLGRHALVVAGGTPGRLESFIRDLEAHSIQCTLFSSPGEPTIPGVRDGVRSAKNAGCEFVIGCGGGSVLDAAKAVAALMTNPGDPIDYVEVIGRGRPLARRCAPCICIPTTAGTGCEATRNAVLISPEHRVKVSLRSPWMLPLLAVVDPELTHSLPPSITAATGMDALTQLIEPFVCNFANPLTDTVCRDGIQRAALWLLPAYLDGADADARENMSLASLFGGLALANSGLGAVHGLAAVLGGMFPMAHGMVCARLLPVVMETNLKALNSRSGKSPAITRYDEVARLLTGKSAARAEEGVEWVNSMISRLSVPRLGDFGMTDKDLPAIAAQAQKSSSIKGNPVVLSAVELEEILHRAL
jgi:alcohol dehydrogenase class IV